MTGTSPVSFEKIGPYVFNWRDLVVASLAISFVLGSRSRRITMALIVIVAIIAMIGGIALDAPAASATVAALLAWIFIVCPALQSWKRSKVCLSFDPEGLAADTDEVWTLYKWAGMRSWRKIGSRLFIMVRPGGALLIADRFTDAANMEKLIATLADHKVT